MKLRRRKSIQDFLSMNRRWGWFVKLGKFITWNTRARYR